MASREALLVTTLLNKQVVLRMCLINPRTTMQDVEDTLRFVRNLCQKQNGLMPTCIAFEGYQRGRTKRSFPKGRPNGVAERIWDLEIPGCTSIPATGSLILLKVVPKRKQSCQQHPKTVQLGTAHCGEDGSGTPVHPGRVSLSGGVKEQSYFTLLHHPPSPEHTALVEAITFPKEEAHITSACVYFYAPKGYGDAKMNNNWLESKLKVLLLRATITQC